MSSAAALVPDPLALARSAYATFVASPAWTVVETSAQGSRVIAAVRPGLQLIDLTDEGAPVYQLVARDGTAFVRGIPWVLALVGWTTDVELLERVLGDQWVSCPADAWLRKGHDHSPVGQLGKGLGDDEWCSVDLVDASHDGTVLTARLRDDFGRVFSVQQDDGGPARFDQLWDAKDTVLRWSWGDDPLDLPQVHDVVTVTDLLTGLGRRPRRRAASRRPPTIQVFAPEEDGEQWSLYSDDLPAAFGVEAGHEAEALALQLLAERRPDLLHLVEGDSFDVEFSAYVPDEATARAVAEVLREAGA